MTALVNSLEKLGYVQRRPDESDRRVALVEITPVGARYLERRRRRGALTYGRLVERLTAAEQRDLLAAGPALRRLAELGAEVAAPAGGRL
jgi:DNA-binding MarR family transcriptional regulator